MKKNKKNNLIVIDESKKGFIFAAVSGIRADEKLVLLEAKNISSLKN